jgi:MoaA/NifB/PqqE/SkfB family radical SAM enzyme
MKTVQITKPVSMKLLGDTPNLSVMLPGHCNAKCEFCFWNRDQQANKFPMMDFADRLARILDSLPWQFSQVSVTGGEPTISPVLDEVMAVLRERRERFPKVVLTTNAVRLMKNRDVIYGVVDHINISRHHHSDLENAAIFKTRGVPCESEIAKILKVDYGADICFNCVVPPTVTEKFCQSYIEWARYYQQIAAVNFRIYHNSMEECRAQKEFEKVYGSTDVTTCPVCRVMRMNVEGMQVNWKYSVQEPTQHWNGIYELVVQPDGRVTADWAGVQEIDPRNIEGGPMPKSNRELAEELIELAKKLLEKDEPKAKHGKRVIKTVYVQSSGGGCSHGGAGGGCR